MTSGLLPSGPLPHPTVPRKTVSTDATKEQAEPPRAAAPVQFMLGTRQPAPAKPILRSSMFDSIEEDKTLLEPRSAARNEVANRICAARAVKGQEGEDAAQLGTLGAEAASDAQSSGVAIDSSRQKMLGRRGWDVGVNSGKSSQSVGSEQQQQLRASVPDAQEIANEGDQTAAELGQTTKADAEPEIARDGVRVGQEACNTRSGSSSRRSERRHQRNSAEAERRRGRRGLRDGSAAAGGSRGSRCSSDRSPDRNSWPGSAREQRSGSGHLVARERASPEHRQSGLRSSVRALDRSDRVKQHDMVLHRREREPDKLDDKRQQRREEGISSSGRHRREDWHQRPLTGEVAQQATSQTSAGNENGKLSLEDKVQQAREKGGQMQVRSGSLEGGKGEVRKDMAETRSAVRTRGNGSLQQEQAKGRIGSKRRRSPSKDSSQQVLNGKTMNRAFGMIIEPDEISQPISGRDESGEAADQGPLGQLADRDRVQGRTPVAASAKLARLNLQSRDSLATVPSSPKMELGEHGVGLRTPKDSNKQAAPPTKIAPKPSVRRLSSGPDTLKGLEAELQAMMTRKRARSSAAGVSANETPLPALDPEAGELAAGKEVQVKVEESKHCSPGKASSRAGLRTERGVGGHGRAPQAERQPLLDIPERSLSQQGLALLKHGSAQVAEKCRQQRESPDRLRNSQPPRFAAGAPSTGVLCAPFCQCVHRRQWRECPEAARVPSKPPSLSGYPSFHLPCHYCTIGSRFCGAPLASVAFSLAPAPHLHSFACHLNASHL
jgi:hypothetical protein